MKSQKSIVVEKIPPNRLVLERHLHYRTNTAPAGTRKAEHHGNRQFADSRPNQSFPNTGGTSRLAIPKSSQNPKA